MRKAIFDKMFDRMDRAVVHGSTFAKNDMAMAAGLATLAVLDDEKLVERAADLGERLIAGLRRRLSGFEFVKEVRGKGLMIAVEFGPPKSLKLRAAYAHAGQGEQGPVLPADPNAVVHSGTASWRRSRGTRCRSSSCCRRWC